MGALLDDGALVCYGGPLPGDVGAPLAAQHVKLCTLRFDNPAFHPALRGVALARRIESFEAVRVGGTLSFFQMVTSTGEVIGLGVIGWEAPCDLRLPVLELTPGLSVSVGRFALSMHSARPSPGGLSSGAKGGPMHASEPLVRLVTGACVRQAAVDLVESLVAGGYTVVHNEFDGLSACHPDQTPLHPDVEWFLASLEAEVLQVLEAAGLPVTVH